MDSSVSIQNISRALCQLQFLALDYLVQRLTAPSTGHYCNEGRISRSIGTNSVQCILIQMYSKWISIGKTLSYGLHLFGQMCTSQIAMEIGRTAYALHCVVSQRQISLHTKCVWKIHPSTKLIDHIHTII